MTTGTNRLSEQQALYVEWIDAAHREGWLDPEEELDGFGVAVCRIVGFVLRDTDEELWLAQSVDTRHGRVDGVMAIPKVAITHTKVIDTAAGSSHGRG